MEEVRGELGEEAQCVEHLQCKFSLVSGVMLWLMERTRPSQEGKYYIDIYNRYLRNEAQSEAAKAVREGREIP